MKKVLLFAAVLFGLVACQNDPKEIGANMGSEQDVNILVSLDSGTRTSSADSAEGAFANIDFEAEGLTLRYIFQVWDEEGKTCKAKQYEYRTTPEVVTFPVRLIPGRNYKFVVWADIVDATTKEDNHYDTDNLSEISLKDGWNAMDETRDAYTGFWSDTYTGNDNITITLTRPFAKVRVVTNDMHELLGVVPTSAVVSYSSQLNPRTTFNALTGKAGARSLEPKTHTYSLEDNIYNENGNSKTLFSDYFFVAGNDIVNFTLIVKDKNNEEIITRSFNTAIPVKRNNLTSIEGNILTVGDEIEVNINDKFTQPGENINIYSGPMDKKIELTSGHYIFNDLSVNTTEDNAVEIADNSDVTIDIVGNVSLKSAGNAIYVPATSKLTINGAVAETRSAQVSKLVIIGGNAQDSDTNGSAIYVDGKLFINNLASLTAEGYGKCGYGIGGMNAEVTINNSTIDYVRGGYVQPLFVNDTSHGKSEPEGGAAIGGAKITIKDSTITKAEGGSKAAAIGNRFWQSTEVVIENSTLVEILGGNASAGIGGSRYASDISADNKQISKIKIENSTVNAVGGQFGAGIGSGYDTHCAANDTNAVNKIIIENSTVTAQGGKYAAGIGTGYHAAALTGSIDAASTINATAGEGFYKDSYTHAQNIGYGVVDPTREYNGVTVTFTVAGEVIDTPKKAVSNGIVKDGDDYFILNADGLKWFAEEVNKYSNYERPFEGKTIVLTNDIDLGGMEWTPIGDYRFSANRFCGTFDGQNHTISNFKITKKTDKNDSNKSSYGFFGNLEGTVKNLTISNATVNSYAYTAALVGRFNKGLIENCHVASCSVSNSYWQGGILIGQTNAEGTAEATVRNCSVQNSSITSKSAIGAISGPVTVTKGGKVSFESCSVNNCTIAQDGSFGGNYDKYFGSMFGYTKADKDSRIDIKNYSVTNTYVKGESNAPISGDFDGNVYINDCLVITSADALSAAIKAGGSYILGANIAMSETTYQNIDFTLDGNGYTISQAEGSTNTYALFDITGGKAAIKNITFDGIKSGAIVRTVGVEFNAENVVAKNCAHTQVQGLFRLMGKSTIKNSTFKNNTCSMVITLNYDGGNNDPQVVENCVFEDNTCNGTAVLYYVKGEKATINGNKFIGNTVNCETNGATVYMGFTENNVVTNNLFQNNTVNEANESSRVAGGVFFGYETVFTGNAFISNKVTGQNAKGNDVCVSTFYTSIDLSGNYWGGNAPVEDTNYFVQHKSDERVVIINNYLTVNPFQ